MPESKDSVLRNIYKIIGDYPGSLVLILSFLFTLIQSVFSRVTLPKSINLAVVRLDDTSGGLDLQMIDSELAEKFYRRFEDPVVPRQQGQRHYLT